MMLATSLPHPHNCNPCLQELHRSSKCQSSNPLFFPRLFSFSIGFSDEAPPFFQFRPHFLQMFSWKLRSSFHPRHEFVEASLLVSETATHYRLLRKGFQEMKWQSSRGLPPFVPTREPRSEVSSMGQGFLRDFQSPNIFLKISCNGQSLLPILVEYAVETLIDTLWGDETGDSPDQFQFLKIVVEKLGYEVRMVRITERVMNTYFSKLYFARGSDILSVDVRPSDAINVANRCKAPIYVNKQIVLSDAVRIGYGMGRVRDRRPVYDVSLDSAADGPDLLSIELGLVRNMALAIKEERYDDAAKWKDKLLKLRNSLDDD